MSHKDNADVSFILLLNEPETEFEGGGTYIDALNATVPLKQGEVLVFNGQLVHSAAPITRRKRYVVGHPVSPHVLIRQWHNLCVQLSGFTNFGENYLKPIFRSLFRSPGIYIPGPSMVDVGL